MSAGHCDMKNGRRSGWAVLAMLALVGLASGPAEASRPTARPAALTATHLRAAPAAAWSNTRSGVRGTAAARRQSVPTPPPAAHRTRTSVPSAVAGRRDDDSGRRRSPESRFTPESARNGAWLAGRLPVAVRDRHAAASVAIFHDANAPPLPVTAVAGRRS
jgi:hypothetical protein